VAHEVFPVPLLLLRTRSLALSAALLSALPAAALADTGGAGAGGIAAGGATIGSVVPAKSATSGGGASTRLRPLARGARGPAVRALQRLLTRAGLPTPVVGIFGPQTERNVRSFQRRAGLRADGVVGARTLSALRRAPAVSTTPPPAPVTPTPEPAPAVPPVDPAVATATLLADGTAAAPAGAPAAVVAVVAAGNRIASTPYKWGGGHPTWDDTGYDCSGSVSYALHGAGLLASSMTSGGLMAYGESGPGRWITIYANADHVYMVVAGLRYDTSGARPSRWQTTTRTTDGYAVRHPAGL